MSAIRLEAGLANVLVDLQNEIAEEFKRMIVKVWDSCEHEFAPFFAAMRELYKQHKSEAYWQENEESPLWDVFNAIPADTNDYHSLYMAIMHERVWDYSRYNDLHIKYEPLPYHFGYSSFYEAFISFTDKAIEQFASGRNLQEKLRKELFIILIVNQYKEERMQLTLRQLYYQMVSKNHIANSEKEYKGIIELTGNMRSSCVLELDEFADNTRFAVRYRYAEKVTDFLKEKLNAYGYVMDTRSGQPNYLEVWIEKEALRSVFKPITDEQDVPLFICRGYPSTSSLFQQAKAISRKMKKEKTIKNVTILYYGDHDPSGLQIPEAIERIFHEDYQMHYVHVKRCGLLMKHIRSFHLPPNPAKLTDPRAESYVREHGGESWELDAVEPKELQRLVDRAINDYTDMEVKAEVRSKQSEGRELIQKVTADLIAQIGGMEEENEDLEEDEESDLF
ncbi:hypothetical protein [Paenibacillus sp. YN15]|uniref:hypothetical protein n=1 Tax=Paenibacillus sp. YN15 TaxID=1742774 RepID=UPI000DCCD11E|nr:hypothetical protein [Paenibacillus sp. YN15]RAU92492.1 hypothetical protein DQG13_27570 [Paenibacillus sp. YN15]